jgi:hypothetical protein
MVRFVQPRVTKGSQKWIPVLVNEKPDVRAPVESPIALFGIVPF